MQGERYLFGEFELDATAFELLRSGERMRLERIPMELLLLLIRRRGDVVSRDEIVSSLWGNEVFIDTNTAINVAIRKVRLALSDSIDSPRFILTVPAKGYRFIGQLGAAPTRLNDELSIDSDPDSGREEFAPASLPGGLEGPAPVAAEQAIADGSQLDWKSHTRTAGNTRVRWLLWMAAAAFLIIVGVAFVRWRHRAPAKKLMFVVLPFQNLTGDPAQEYVADGMTEEMIAQMGALDPEHIGVIARTTAMRFKATPKDAAQIARELGVAYLLEGSIRRAGDRLRVTAQLIQASDQTHLWAENYDSDMSDLLKLEGDIATAIAGKVQVKLDANSGRFPARTVRPEAQAAYLRGLEDLNLRTNSSITNAIAEFQQAIAADPDYGLAYAALARCYVLGPIFGVGNPMETMPRARELANRALQLNPGLAEAHSDLAMVAAHYDFDWPTAEREFLTALRLNPSDPNAHFFYSNSFLSPHGRHQEAIGEMRKASALDPLSIPLQAYFVRTYVWARRYADARDQTEKTNEVAPNFVLLHERSAHLYAAGGDFTHAIEEDSRARLLSGEPAEQVIARRDRQLKAVAQGGSSAYWQALLDSSRQEPNPPEAYVTPFGLAVVYANLGLNDQALTSLEQAFDRRDFHLTELNVEPAFDALHTDPRFQALLRRIHLI